MCHAAVGTSNFLVKQVPRLACQGVHVGICMIQLEASLGERGIACTPMAVATFTGATTAVNMIQFLCRLPHLACRANCWHPHEPAC